MKRFTSLIIMMALVMGLLPAHAAGEAPVPTFTDVPAGSWFEEGVLTCAQKGIMVGTGENTFSPNATLTDAETLMLAYRLYDQANGGDGSLLKMPEDYGYIRITLADGSVVREGYAGDGSLWTVPNIHYSSDGYRLCLVGYSADEESKAGGATLTYGGKKYRGTLQGMYRGSGRYEQDRFFGFEPEDPTLNNLLCDAYFHTAPPTQWWADLLYTIHQKGWDNVFYDALYLFGNEDSRGSFADLLGSVTALPKRFDIPPIPDIPESEPGDNPVWDHTRELYEAGIIGGMDAYGTFAAEKTLTRAEAAVMVARILDESQRLTAPPKSMPKEGEGYTLTYLMDGAFSTGYTTVITYPRCVVGKVIEGIFYVPPEVLLTLEGESIPWTEDMERTLEPSHVQRNWGGLQISEESPSLGLRPYYRWSDGTPATEWFDWCGEIGPDGRGFVQKDGKIYRIEFTQP